MTNTIRIAFIGGGNMATALISGLVNPPRAHLKIRVSDPSEPARKRLEKTFGVPTFTDSTQAIDGADVIVLAVKPQVVRQVAEELAETVRKRQPLVISIAAGIRCDSLQNWLGGHVALVRSMPNTPALIQSAASVLYAMPQVDPSQREKAESL